MKFYYYLIIYIIIFYLIYLLYETDDPYSNYRTLEDDGYIILNMNDKEDVLKYLPNNYYFINYKYEIKGSSLSTFHRDVTSSQYIFKTKYPVYTLIEYHNKGPLLSVSPNSHITTPFLFYKSHIINSNYNKTYILFNCDLIHSGTINIFGKNRHLIQYKICHKDDLYLLKHLIGINKKKELNEHINKNYEYISRKTSLLFPYFFNHILTPHLQNKQDSIIGRIFYNIYGRDFYNS